METHRALAEMPLPAHEAKRTARQALGRWQGVLSIAALTLLFAMVNGFWLRANVVTYGWDRMDHLIASLGYNDILRPTTPTTLFEALAWSDYYPPLVHLIAVLGYKLFGVSEDVAAMMNVLYLALLLGATWSIGRRLGGTPVALLATLVVGTFPMVVVMSRYLYVDFALTGLVAASVALLLATERFTRRGPSLLLGLALGAAFLVKWTAAAFLAAPLLWIVGRSGVAPEVLRRPALLRPAGQRLGVALLAGATLAALWLLPARTVVRQQPLGLWLVPLFALLFAAVAYTLFALRRAPPADAARARVANALGAGAVAALVMALWYLPNVNFLTSFYVNAYGKPTGRHWAYARYVEYVVTEQLGPLYTLVFVLVAVGLLVRWLRQGGLRRLRALGDTRVVLLLWAAVPFLLFASRVSTVHSRYLMPFLPPFAAWIAWGLWRLRPPALRVTAIVVVMALAWSQFAIISFDALDPWRDRFTVSLGGTPVNLLSHGFSIQFAAARQSDPRYLLAPEVLGRIETARAAEGRAQATLGLLVNSYQLHEKHFLYQIYTRFPRVWLRELARNWSDQPAYNQLFEMDWVLVSDTHSYRTAEASQAVVARLLGNPTDRFHRAFREAEQWVLPNGERITLYARRFAPTQPGIAPEDYAALVQQWGPEWGEGDALLLAAPDQAYILGLLLPETSPVATVPLPGEGQTVDEALATLERGARQHRRLFLLDHNARAVDPDGRIEAWLRAHTTPGPEAWIGSVRLLSFVPVEPPAQPTQRLGVTFGAQGPTLAGAAWPASSVEPGGALVGTLFWADPVPDGVKLSLQLLAPDGALVAQRDTDVAAGAQPHALLAPRAVAPGRYRLVLRLYRADTLDALPLPDGADALELATVEVVSRQ